MNQQIQPHEIAKKEVVYRMAGADAVLVRRDVAYNATESDALTMDVYYPRESNRGERHPAVVFVSGYPDGLIQKVMGCKQKEMASYVSWGRLTAASGIAAITYMNRDPVADVHELLEFVRANAASLGIDEGRIGLWACSGNVPMALSLLMEEPRNRLKCAVLCYGFMLDLDGSTTVAEAARTWGFCNPCAGKSVDDLPRDLPLLVVRAGQDQFPHLNETMDHFLYKGLSCNLPITLLNHALAPHAFDILEDTATSCEVIKQILGFLRFQLS